MCNNNGDTFYRNIVQRTFDIDLCNRLFSMIMLMNLGHTCLFNKGFCTGYFFDKDKNAVTLPHNAQRKHAFLGKIKQMLRSKELAPRKKVDLELLHMKL